MANVINIDKQIQESVKDLPDGNYMLGRTLLQPFKPANSGSRALMSSIHIEHMMVPTHGEVPIIQTGYETEFGEASSSFVRSNSNYKVLYKINKFEYKNDHYFLIVQDVDTGIYDVIERISYKHNTERYGFLWNNSILDGLNPGDTIDKDSIIKTSIGYDEYGSKKNGVNLLTVYLSCAQNMEDSIIISESAAKKMETTLIESTSVTINDNDILLNLYGDENIYKTFPDIGEEIKGGVFCSIRRIENNNILYSLSQQRLRDHFISDKNILLDGIVADIDVYCNNPEALGDSHYNQQLFYYYNQRMNFCKQINDIVAPLAVTSKLSYNLQKLYAICRDTISGSKPFFKDKQFSNVIMEVTVLEQLPMGPGDKLADRYGGKGVISKVIPDKMMPVLDNGYTVEVIKNQSTCINRENIGQLHEQSLSFIGMRILDLFRTETLTASDKCEMWYKFVHMVDPDQANWAMGAIDFYDEFQAAYFIDSILEEDDAIILSSPPFTTPINIDTINDIYKVFDWIKPYKINVPIEDSNGNIRFIKTRRPLVCGRIYNYRLKQYAKEKFSVTSLSATNLKGLNTRSKANKVYEAKFTKTPIMFGHMESGDMAHLGMQYVVMNLMLYSSSPQARRLFEQLLIGDPYDIDIRLDSDSKNRNAEIINALLKTMGLKLVFSKIPKVKRYICRKVLVKYAKPNEYKPKTNIREIMGEDDLLHMKYIAAKRDHSKPHLIKHRLIRHVDPNEKRDNNGEV